MATIFFVTLFLPQANRWWLHLHRLLTREWNKDLQASNPLQLQRDPVAAPGGVPISDDPPPVQQAFRAPDWPSARGFFPDWLWSGLVSKKGGFVAKRSSAGPDAASLDHARGKGVRERFVLCTSSSKEGTTSWSLFFLSNLHVMTFRICGGVDICCERRRHACRSLHKRCTDVVSVSEYCIIIGSIRGTQHIAVGIDAFICFASASHFAGTFETGKGTAARLHEKRKTS